MGLTVATLETLFTANVQDFEKKADAVDKAQKTLAKADPTVQIKADETNALAAMGRVQDDARKINATTAEATLSADPSKAKAGVDEAAGALARIDGDTATIKILADTSRAKGDIGALGDEGEKAGKDAGEGVSTGILAAIIALPVAGAIIGVGAAIGKSLMDGLQVEVRSDTLMAKTGLDAQTIAPIARAAGEAYANNFGESISSNMETARVAIQGGLLDVDGTEKDSQAVIESLSGVADVIGNDIARVSRSTATLLRTGLAVDAQGAFDLLVKGTQAGLDISEDMLDTVDEYSTQFRALGLTGPEAFGLLQQAIQGGARDTDTAADSLKEFAIRAVDGSKTTIDGFKSIGLNAEEMGAKIAAGGKPAAEALGLTLDKLRAIKDPAEQARVAVELFGTKAEDMGEALYTMDLSTAVAQLGTVEGAAKSAIDTLGDNTAGKLETARRNIEVAADGIKGALATAFAPQIEGFATFVTENREAVLTFLLDMANGSIDAGRALADAAAAGIEGFGNMVGTVGPQITQLLDSIVQGVVNVMNMIPGQHDAAVELAESFNAFRENADKGFAATKEGAGVAADALRENLIKNGLDPAQKKLNEVAIPMIAQAALHDASVSLAKDLDGIGYAGDGSRLKLDTLNGTVKTNTESGRLLDDQIRKAVASLDAEALAGAGAGESQRQLTTRYEAGRQALIAQLTQMGYTGAEAKALADKYRAIPGKAETKAILDKAVAEADIVTLQRHIDEIKQGKKPGLDADTAAGRAKIAALQAQIDNLRDKTVTITTFHIATGIGGTGGSTMADGGTFHAAGGLSRQSMLAKGGANILWAEPETGWETYISGKPSQRARNVALLEETARRFGLAVMPAQTPTYSAGSTAAAAGPGLDLSGVRADLAEQTAILRSLVPGFSTALDRTARAAQTMQRQGA